MFADWNYDYKFYTLCTKLYDVTKVISAVWNLSNKVVTLCLYTIQGIWFLIPSSQATAEENINSIMCSETWLLNSRH